jgi:hypothetical protein
MFGGYKFISRERLSKKKVNITNVELPEETEPESVN